MTQKYSTELLKETEKLKREKEALQQQLMEARTTIDALKTGNIDAVVITREKDLKIFIEKTAEKPYRILIERMHEGAVMLNEHGFILYCNSSFANMVKLPLQKTTGTVFRDYMDDSLKEHFEDWRTDDIMNAFKKEGNIYSQGGVWLPVLMTANAMWLDTIFVINIVLTDLTILNENLESLKQKAKLIEEKNEELEKVNQALAFQIEEKEKQAAELAIAETEVKELEGLNTHKENILTTISHDLRSPLAGIIQIAELLKDEFKNMEVDEVQNMLEHIYNLTIEELRMLDYLVEWARIKYAAEAYTPAQIKLHQYVRKVFDTLNEMAESHNVQLYNEINENITVFADGKMLHSILQNIVSNSIKHTSPGGKVTAYAKSKDNKIIVEIKDTGIGMSQEVVKKLFAPQMGTLSNARKEDKGAGIGLLLIKGFVDKNGGEIWVESTAGEGTSFNFTLLAEKPME